MPIERARLDRMISLMDAWLQRRDREIAEGTYYDDDDEPPCNPLDATPSEPFYSDGPPERIHGEGREDQVASPWGEKPKVPIPIEHL
jgi:hypothetical protein